MKTTREIQEERVQDLNEERLREDDYVLCWMQSSQRRVQPRPRVRQPAGPTIAFGVGHNLQLKPLIKATVTLALGLAKSVGEEDRMAWGVLQDLG